MALQYIEDYLEFFYGSMDKEGTGVKSTHIHSPLGPIKLATYDRSPITSMGSFCFKVRVNNLTSCLTDRQIGLAKTIIFKYQRQLLSLGIELPKSIDDLSLRHPVRSIDRIKNLSLVAEQKKLLLRFPYDPKKVSALHEYTSNSAGKTEWNNQDKQWEFDYTEGNLSTILKLFENDNLKIDDALEPVVVDMLTASKKDLPTFAVSESKMELINCHASVHEYLATKQYNQFDIDNLPLWTSLAITLGLEIDPSVISKLENDYGSDVSSIMCNRIITLPSNNQPDGPWYNTLLNANSILKNHDWVLYLTWWTSKTSWSPFSNLVDLSPKDKNSYRIEPSLVESFSSLTNPIVVLDSAISRDGLRTFIENSATKVIYISDIGKT